MATPLTAKYAGGHPTVPPLQAAQNLLAVLDALTPAQSGGFYDWTGQGDPVVRRLVLVLGDQLSPGIAALRAADPARDVVVMAEVRPRAAMCRIIRRRSR